MLCHITSYYVKLFHVILCPFYHQESAAIAQAENEGRRGALFAHRGVKKLWALDIVPYACHVHWTIDLMHCWDNVIKDMINSLRPTTSGDSKLYRHTNRTTSANVIEGCRQDDIHHHLHNEDTVPSWIFTKKECMEADAAMLKIIGKCTYEERPLNVMRAGKAGRSSHDTIFWAMTYARWCFRNKGCDVYTNNMCDIFDILSTLNGGRINGTYVREVLKPKLINLLVARAGILPPSECLITLHEALHICDQVKEVGLPRMSSLFKFERVNLMLKKLLKNAAKGTCHITSYYVKLCYVILRHITSNYVMSYYVKLHICSTMSCTCMPTTLIGLPSIIKNFVEHESIEMEMLLSIPMMDKLNAMATYQPTNCAPKHLDSLLKKVFVDLEPAGPDMDDVDPLLYEIDSAAVLELKGESHTYPMSQEHFNLLLYTAAADVEDESTLLHVLNGLYRTFQHDHPRTHIRDFSGFIMYMFNEHLGDITAGKEEDAVFMDDLSDLTDLIDTVIDEGCFRILYVHAVLIYLSLCQIMSYYVKIMSCQITSNYVKLCYLCVCHIIYVVFIRPHMSKVFPLQPCPRLTYPSTQVTVT